MDLEKYYERVSVQSASRVAAYDLSKDYTEDDYLDESDCWCQAMETNSPYAFDREDWTELTFTTDPTEAPADALLEAAGYYVMPGDRIAVGLDFPFSTVAHWRADGTWAHDLRVLERGGWDPYSWDVKRVLTEREGVLIRDAIVGYVSAAFDLAVAVGKQRKTPCTQCNGSGRVDGFLGVGIQIPCGECGGEGSK